MADSPVVNASPLILLAQCGRFDLLRVAGSRIVVPTAVATEIGQRGSGDVTVRAMTEANWLNVVHEPSIPNIILSWDLGPGESAVIAWAHANPGTEAICDDLLARRCAATLGIPVRGTIGIVLLAKRRGIIPAARPVLEQMVRNGMYLSERVLDQALALVGE